MSSIGEELVFQLAKRGVDTVFGIPGVHTVELYRGLAGSGIRHVTPRHEQGAGFMADGYARVSGRPGVAFVITGPGLTNTLTAMGQARADSVPMLVVSGVNTLPSLGKGMGHLHELPDQQALASLVALSSERIETGGDLLPAIEAAFQACSAERPGPAHIEIPLDVAGDAFDAQTDIQMDREGIAPDEHKIARAVEMLQSAKRPVILAGGGIRKSPDLVRELAEKLGAPVVQTVNARGLLHSHPLGIPASPSLQAVRDLIGSADVVLAAGTELGPTDYDMYATGTMPHMRNLIRVDISEEQLARHPSALAIHGDAADVLTGLNAAIQTSLNDGTGAQRADQSRQRAFDEIGPEMQQLTLLLNAMRDVVPEAIVVGDSAQPIYAGNLYYDHDRPGGWFNAATGFGALGYGIPAAIGAALAADDAPVICITGDGGAQFSLPELMAAKDEGLPIIFIVWNNHGYQEIETSMQAVSVTVVGCDPTPPDFKAVAASCAIPFCVCPPETEAFVSALKTATETPGPVMIEIRAPKFTATN
ncbi:5-guanidino-2-oxopentanoate decarboxylase [Aliiroseovarius sp. KMU-50]|uniref:5-guanidino-2-oxopentanoate decarboxylase n=1 Tax=Aliiroseovarius salicola TaxID=3009082 RepID=A0ABT4VZL5_9RHOB|nr:5-guanidino-2-oxopentanoate decarboxylase [Aliiroseovarius sp. KMU-50]MDA5093706.1 5-guanidino-2-oxopentanoate decarboxylase [Aliiroseovarius sp. KMU-50]